MKPLEGYRIVVASPRCAAGLAARVTMLERAGAAVRTCVLGQTLWSELSDGVTDIVVFIPEEGSREGLVAYEQLGTDPRTRPLPALLLTDAVPAPNTRAVSVLRADSSDESLLQAISDLVAPFLRLNELEQQLREQRAEELERAERCVSERADLAHEVRSMLSAVMGFACNLRDEIAGPLTLDQRTHVARILEAVDRATKVLQRKPTGNFAPVSLPRQLSVRPSRPSPSGPPRAQRSFVSLGRIATEIVELFKGIAARRSLALTVEIDDTVALWGDGLKLKQVVSNLVVNALKYAEPHGTVKVQVRWVMTTADGISGRRSAELVVSDDGFGIPLEHRESIFQRGFRLEQHQGSPGDGIGLAVVREIVRQHAGTVIATDGEGSGALFRVLLPQDRRQRARSGALVMQDGPAARALLDAMAAADPPLGQLVAPSDQEFLEWARNCRAHILVASDHVLSAALDGPLSHDDPADERSGA